ncbi:hypothetical protein MMC18_000237 [Xylographa bjoerkii]|nr:hypothetical protein [Xylographa bjoerkii]
MSALKIGDSFPEGVTFSYVPYTPEKDSLTACGIPINYDASKEWVNKKVVLFSVPGAFTPGCSVRHLPGFIDNLEKIKSKGVDIVAVIAYNDAFVMNAWSKANGVKNDDIVCFSALLFFACSVIRAHVLYLIDKQHEPVTYGSPALTSACVQLFLSDVGTKFSQTIGWTMGERTARYALIIDHGKITYAEKEASGGDVSVSGADAVLAKL